MTPAGQLHPEDGLVREEDVDGRWCPRHGRRQDKCRAACIARWRESGSERYGADIDAAQTRVRNARDMIQFHDDPDAAHAELRQLEGELEAESEDGPADALARWLVDSTRRHIAELEHALSLTDIDQVRAEHHMWTVRLHRLTRRAREIDDAEAAGQQALIFGDQVLLTGRRSDNTLDQSQSIAASVVDVRDAGPPGADTIAATPHLTNGPPSARAAGVFA